MKKCTYCGKEYPDEATECAVDQLPLKRVGAPDASQYEPDTAPTGHSPQDTTALAIAHRNMVVGGLWCGGGILVTLLTFAAASGGGSYVVAWGAILFGGIQFFLGFVARSRL